ncbi:MAG: CehA/McbA family metallohydrolase, partial [Acidobacteria bacterium]|nr:CehA/McbA family metallohydrolase [Acidobacteriota bacterium]
LGIVASLFPPNTVPFRVTREQGGLAGYAHGAGPNFATDLALDNVDFVEANSAEAMEPLYHAWNCGYRVVASAGEDAFPNFYRSYIIGTDRVYVKTGPKLDYDKWHADFRAGRSFVTNGPLVLFTVNGKDPGDEIKLPAGNHALKIVADVESIMPVESIELLHNGEVIETLKPTGKPLKARFEKTVSIDHSGWYAIRTRAQYARHPIRAPYPFAATMPVWVTVDDKPVRSKKDADYFVAWIDRTLERALKTGPWNNEQEKDEVRKLYTEARARMLARGGEAER